MEDREQELIAEIAQLRDEHRRIGEELDGLVLAGRTDPVHLQRLKKRKLALKDRIAELSDQLFPDIIA